MRAKRDLKKVKKDLGKMKGGKGRVLGRVLMQGAAAAPKKPWGSRKPKGKVNVRTALNATLPTHLGLPRAIGDYAVIRTTSLLTSHRKFNIFCPMLRMGADYESAAWYASCGLGSVDSTQAVNHSLNTVMYGMPLSGLNGAASAVPAALTVQVMNPQALQTTTGIFAMGRANTPFIVGGETRTYDTLSTEFISFCSPRLLSAAKLALRGVQASAYPLNMNEYSEFEPFHDNVDIPFSWNSSNPHPAAMTPIIFIGDGSTVINFLVTIEWRVRFDPTNPAIAAHTFHDIVPDTVYNDLLKGMSAMGHGVEDIAEGVAAAGEAAASAV